MSEAEASAPTPRRCTATRMPTDADHQRTDATEAAGSSLRPPAFRVRFEKPRSVRGGENRGKRGWIHEVSHQPVDRGVRVHLTVLQAGRLRVLSTREQGA